MKGQKWSKCRGFVAAIILTSMLVSLMTGCPRRAPAVPPDAPIRVAIAGPMAFIHGDHKWKGAVMAAEEINAAGGVTVGGQKRPLELVKVDTNELLSVPDAASAVERAITVDNVDVIIGGFRSEAVLAMMDVAMDHKVLHLGVGSISPAITDRVYNDFDRYKYFFRVFPYSAAHVVQTSFLLLQEAAAVVREELGIEKPKVAVMVEKVLGFDPVAVAAPKAIPAMNMEVVGLWRPSQVATDVTSELAAIRESGAHIIFSILSGPVGIAYARQWEEMQIPAVSVGVNVEAMGGRFWQATGNKGNYEATLTFLANTPVTEKSVPFFNNFVEKHGEFPIYLAATYDAVYILAEAIERAGSLEGEALVTAMRATDYKGTAGRFVFDERHDPLWGPEHLTGLGIQWIDGVPTAFWPNGWQGLRFEGTQRFRIAPWVLEHWRN